MMSHKAAKIEPLKLVIITPQEIKENNSRERKMIREAIRKETRFHLDKLEQEDDSTGEHSEWVRYNLGQEMVDMVKENVRLEAELRGTNPKGL